LQGTKDNFGKQWMSIWKLLFTIFI